MSAEARLLLVSVELRPHQEWVLARCHLGSARRQHPQQVRLLPMAAEAAAVVVALLLDPSM